MSAFFHLAKPRLLPNNQNFCLPVITSLLSLIALKMTQPSYECMFARSIP